MKKTLSLFLMTFLSAAAFAQVDANEAETSGNVELTATTAEQESAELIERMENLVTNNNKKIKKQYFREVEQMGYGGPSVTTTVKVKNKLYEAGQILMMAQNDKPARTDEEKISQLEEVIRIQDRLLFLIQQPKTRNLEKSLKKLENPKEIAPVFFGDF